MYHRLVGLTMVPCTACFDATRGGREQCEPYRVPRRLWRFYEVNHMGRGDTRDCRVASLEPLPKKLHRSLERGGYLVRRR